MSNPKFVYDGKTLSFAEALSSMERRKASERDIVFSASGKAGSVFEHALDQIEIELELFDDRAFYRDLQAWWAWACQGQEYAFALDAADTVDTTLDASAAAGQKVIPLTSTTGIVASSRYRVRSADLTKEENMSKLVQTTDTGFSAYTDYVAGRMMKTGFYVTSDGVLTISPDKPRFDYQSWIVKYPTPEKLIEAVYKSFE